MHLHLNFSFLFLFYSFLMSSEFHDIFTNFFWTVTTPATNLFVMLFWFLFLFAHHIINGCVNFMIFTWCDSFDNGWEASHFLLLIAITLNEQGNWHTTDCLCVYFFVSIGQCVCVCVCIRKINFLSIHRFG